MNLHQFCSIKLKYHVCSCTPVFVAEDKKAGDLIFNLTWLPSHVFVPQLSQVYVCLSLNKIPVYSGWRDD